MKIKPGWKSSEFWVTFVSFIFSGLYLTGILSDHSQKEELIGVGGHVVESIILIFGQLLIFYRYVKGRNEVKKIVENENLETIKQARSKKDESERVSNKRTRKTSSRTKAKTTRSKKSSSKRSVEKSSTSNRKHS
jgi:hypothetical protein